MGFDTNDEILQDFLVEATEILERLGEQLIELEHTPDDKDLLNAVFRGFHTIKGGAGFLSITSLVTVCHRAEDVFNVLRQGKRRVDADLMDAVLKVVDVVTVMMNSVRGGEDPEPADDSLIKRLEQLAVEDGGQAAAAPVVKSEPPKPVDAGQDKKKDEVDKEFEEILSRSGDGKAAGQAAAPAAASSDEITDEEFERLLDDLHGAGKHGGVPPVAVAGADTEKPVGDEITEDEFEKLLDQLHGVGRGPAGAAPAVNNSIKAEAPVAKPKAEAASAPTDKGQTGEAPAAKTQNKDAGQQAETTVRVDTKRLDDIMNMVGELVLVRNRLSTLKSSMQDEHVAKAVANLDIVTSDLQTAVMKTRMQPIKKVFSRFPRVVRDLARSLNKEINLEMVGEETDLDKNIVEALADPLVHLVRNSIDHGIESPDIRVGAGKSRAGKIVLSARQEGDHISISIEDDGAGMDAEKLKFKAIEKGILTPDVAERMDQKECFNLIFLPGFSMKQQISDISGRGVGMDVVKTRISQLNGTVEIDSRLGVGTTIDIKLPLTLAIMPTLMVTINNQIFAFPLANVSEIFHVDSLKTSTVDGKKVVVLRNKTLPLFYLRDWLALGGTGNDDSTDGYIVIVKFGTQSIGYVVDQLVGQEEVVIKPLGALLHGIKGFAGATITGNGRISLILDMPELTKKYARSI